MTTVARAIRLCLALPVVAACAACTPEDREMQAPSTDGLDGTTGDGSGGASGSSGVPADSDGPRFDLGASTGATPPCGEGEDCDDACAVPPHMACDAGTADLMQAIGLGCAGELQISGTVLGAPEARGVLPKFGATGEWAPREGSSIAVLGTGTIADLSKESPDGDPAIAPTNCNDDLGAIWDRGTTLPEPLKAVNVAGDCSQDAGLVGSGDCSKSIQEQFQQGVSVNDYSELRFTTTVPNGSTSFSYDLAFMSVEYPGYYFSEFNDMYVGWLESERWTGNVSFDGSGNPISLNASFLDFRDDASNLPELAGTCMRGHAATTWLTTTAPVTPGEEITVVFAIFDLSDSILDSYVLLDNFQWGCVGTDKPETIPVG